MKRAISSALLLCALVWCGCEDEDATAAIDAGRDAAPADDGGGAPRAGGPADSGLTDAALDAHMPVTDAGDDDGGAPASDAGGDALDYYPVPDGARWVYRHSGGSRIWDEEVWIDEHEYEGASALRLSDSPGPSGTRSESILVRDGTQILRVHREEFADDTLLLSADYDPGFLRFDHAWATAELNQSQTLGYARVERDHQGEITADGERAHRYTLEARADRVEVPAGEFEDCLRIRRSRVRAQGETVAEGDEDLFWFCPGIGKVREEDQTTFETEELVSCDIPNGACPG